jgi:hypothetical protein
MRFLIAWMRIVSTEQKRGVRYGSLPPTQADWAELTTDHFFYARRHASVGYTAVGLGSQYMLAFVDSQRNPFDGGKKHRLQL